MQRIICFLALTAFGFTYAQKDITVETLYKSYQFYAKSVPGFNGMQDGQHFTKLSNANGLTITKH
ncbi:MAG TPA: hypothetical protein VKZ44_02930, partial [Taishania sp.]|nr:hypothetical protein [Taishania sp.]